MPRLIILCLLLLFVMPISKAQNPVFVPKDCTVNLPPRQAVTCGDLFVPEDYSQAEGEQIRLDVVILHNSTEATAPDPIIYLEGGPGGSAIETLEAAYRERYRPLLAAKRDIILFDQRGVGQSEPALDCPSLNLMTVELLDFRLGTLEFGDNELLANLPEVELTYETVQNTLSDVIRLCVANLADSHALEQYNSRVSAQDIEHLRQALGYEQVNLWAISYGTRLAQVAMRDYSEHIRTVLLDSVVPLEADFFASLPLNWSRALEALFATCANDAACNTTYPQLERIFYQTVQALNATPVRMDLINPITRETYKDSVFDGETFLIMTIQLLYESRFLPMLPQMIYEMAEGNYYLYALMLAGSVAQQELISYGAYFSSHCYESIPFTDTETLEAAYENYPRLRGVGLGGIGGVGIFDICAAMDIRGANASELVPVSSAIPTLVFSGQYDPVTPPAWAAQVARHLSSSQYFNFNATGHGASASLDCAQTMAVAFFLDPLAPVDSACMADLQLRFRGAQAVPEGIKT